MAPRRGGGSSGGSGIFNHRSSHCSSSAFTNETIRVRFAFDVIFFVAFVVLAIFAGFLLLRSKRKGKAIVRWWLLAFSIGTAILGFGMSIIITALDQCGVIRGRMITRLTLVSTWCYNTSILPLVAALMIPICRRMLRAAGRGVNLVTIVHSAFVGVMAIILLSTLSYLTAFHENSQDLEIEELRAWNRRLRELFTTYATFITVGVCMGSAVLLLLVVRHSNLRAGSLKIAVPVLLASAIGNAIGSLAAYVDVAWKEYEGSDAIDEVNRRQSAAMFIINLLYCTMFLSALAVAKSRHLSDDPAMVPAAMAPVVPQNAYPPPQNAYPPPQNAYPPPQNAYPPQNSYAPQTTYEPKYDQPELPGSYR